MKNNTFWFNEMFGRTVLMLSFWVILDAIASSFFFLMHKPSSLCQICMHWFLLLILEKNIEIDPYRFFSQINSKCEKIFYMSFYEIGSCFVYVDIIYWRMRCSSMVRSFTHGAIGRWIDPSWWTHWAISHTSQCSMTGITNAVVCAILSVGWCI